MQAPVQPRASALLPLLLFLLIFLGSGIYYSLTGTDFAFYQIKAPVAILPAIILGLLLAKPSYRDNLQTFIDGIGDRNIITMALVFLLAGAFSSVTKAIGGVDATVNMGLSILPPSLILPGLFVIAVFISTSMGTSMGTIGALVPIALGFAEVTGLSLPLAIGAVVGGAMAGDNLSIISDTTIAATRTQGVGMRDKFRLNLTIALPAMLLTLVVLFLLGDTSVQPEPVEFNYRLVMPYLVVLILALFGLDVMIVLMTGIILSGITGMLVTPEYQLATYGNDIYQGFAGMLEIMVLSMLIGGLSAIMKQEGGLDWLRERIQALAAHNAGRRSGETGIAGLVAATNLFVANNTVAIIISGSVAKDLADHYNVDPRRSASLLDIFSCVVQGLIPYGAQILLAGSLAALSPLALITQVHYCWLLGLMAALAIVFGFPRVKAPATSD
ncbi:sodium:proton antiporter [Halopseudomonas pachastrellae]|uniref:Sodium:proton antiporter n=1 Tax=Halopseudomonas pachastrellae TaxID=254161 RepID=A0A1S8DKF0_9GAMM|nr:Na+/H+ antiporter NhaC family protein [Halopseudomonas pachastrellae]ONM45814.1 sodium:proton antiporter [Halopseudomonas pachastrellae]SFL98979.1 Na+/H+ antiporter NhaC [Halopseudomonas pachastrellae]